MHTPAFRHTLLCHLLRVASSIPASSSSALSERKSAALNWTSFKEKKTYEKKKMDKKNEAPKTGMQIFSKDLARCPRTFGYTISTLQQTNVYNRYPCDSHLISTVSFTQQTSLPQ